MVINSTKTWAYKIPLAFALILTGSMVFAQQVARVSPKGTGFLLYTPPGYPANGPYPLLIVLHGQGGLGDNLNMLINRDDIPSKLIAQNKWPTSYPFIVVSPQLKRDLSVPDPADQLWPPEMVDEVVEFVKAEYAVDANKTYITGLSQGAHGSYSYTATFPTKIAAAVYISGVPDSTIACQIKDIPVWIFHGTDDSLVPPVFAKGLERALAACSPKGRFKPQLNMLYGRRHEGWNEVYNNSNGLDIYNWMLKFTKTSAINTSPHVSAGPDVSMVASAEPLHVYGEFFDSDGTISSVVWRKISGPAVNMEEISSKFLKLTNLTPGSYEFELTVIDDDGARAQDRVQVNIVAGISGNAVTGLMLMNGNNQRDIAALRDGYVIDPETLTRNVINIRAITSGAPGSIRFVVNSNHNARTADHAPFVLATPTWTVEEGEYLVCATPYSNADGSGTAGISQCYKIIVSTEAVSPPPTEPPQPEPPPTEPRPTHFFAKSGADISALSSWSSNEDGTGTSPASFVADNQTFDVAKPAVLNNPLTIGGTGSRFRIIDGGELALNEKLNTVINMEANAVLHVNSNHTITPGTFHQSSVTHFNSKATTIPRGTYGHLNLHGNESIKRLAGGTTDVAGNLFIAEGVLVEGAAYATSVLAVSENVKMDSRGLFYPENPFSLAFVRGANQIFNLTADHALFHEIIVRPNTAVELKEARPNSILELGSSFGGGLTVESGGRFLVHQNELFINGMGSVNPDNQSGQVGFRKSDLRIKSSTDLQSHLYTFPDADSLNSMGVNLTGTGGLSIHSPIFVIDHMNPINGVINSNGHLALISTRTGTARMSRAEGNGRVNGDVVFQRFIGKGKQTRRYISLPVAGVSVAKLQEFIPVTGNFNGASNGSGLPDSASLHYFDERSGGWVPYPENNQTETLQMGRGYSVVIPDPSRDTKLVVAGPLHQGEFIYTLTPNEGNDPFKGWNLIGNPYASSIEWHAEGWTREGSGAAAYVLDDRYPGGRYLVWDGEIGDPEFAGHITQGQGFFVRSTGVTPLLKISEQAKTDTTSTFWRRKETEDHSGFMAITVKQNDLIDRAFLKFSPAARNAFEESDAVKRRNGYFSLSTLSSDSVALAINTLGLAICDQSIAIVLDGPPGNYSFTFEGSQFNSGREVNLVDHITGEVVKLDAGTQYNFQTTTAEVASGKVRFVIQMPSGTLEDPVISIAENILSSNVAGNVQWFLNGEKIQGATGNTFEPEVSGEYSVSVTVDNCTRTSEPVFITVTVTGIHEIKNSNVIVYPNPASESIRVQFQAPGDIQYTITNAIGVQVARGVWGAETIVEGVEIDVSRVPPGVYFLDLRRKGWVVRRKFVVDPGIRR